MADVAVVRAAHTDAVALSVGWWATVRDLLIVLALAALAAAIRWPNVNIVPPYTDETEEALRAWAIARGELRPLVNVDAYIGALWSYVVAAGFAATGRSAEWPRLASLLGGALTVGMTFLLGRKLYGPRAGLLAALLLAVNATHVLVNSHVAWSNCVTPLFTTAAFWLLLRALERPGNALRLGLAGLAWGMTLQTHPSVIAFLAGAGLYALLRDPRLPLRPSVWLAALLAAVGYSNVLAYNLSSGFDTLTQAARVGNEYAGGSGLDGFGYIASLLGILVLIVQAVAGVVDPRLTAGAYLSDPRVLVALVGLVAALTWTIWRRDWLLLCVTLPVVILVPALNQRWSPILAARYIMPLVPLALVVLAGMLMMLAARYPAARTPGAVWATVGGVAAVVGIVQLGGLWAYYGVEIAAGRSNAGPWQMIRLVDEQRRAREPFVVHADLHLLPSGGGGTWAKALDYLLELEDVRKDVSPREPGVRLRACDVTTVVLRYVERDERRRPARDEPRHERYWIARPAPLPGERREEQGRVVVETPYALPWVNRSLFDPRAPTFETGCE
ncbi:MAG: glycosyltransferase family 39 protein [Chloroflexi bacterium]|nr:glycosyltransferase family 39 protein [Chloroflexota bacterium]